jgi:hypothetical protein
MNYTDINSINKTSYLYPPPESSALNKYYTKKEEKLNKQYKPESHNNIPKDNKYKFVKYNTNENINIKNENKYAYSLIWKAIHYISNFLNSIPGEEYETENAYIVFIKCISELLPNEEYSRHMKEFILKYPLNNLKTTNDKFKWSYKLHSYINFMKFVKNLKYYILTYSKKNVELILNNYCVSLEFNKQQIQTCTYYINNKIKTIMNENNGNYENNGNMEDYIFVENISYKEALNRYTITDTNLITKNDWGPTIWMMIHFFAANLSKSKINIYIEFIKTLIYVIPCEECRKHLRSNLQKIPLYFNDKSDNLSIFEWTCGLHNLVNTQLKKPTYNYCKTLFYKYLDSYNSIYEYM